MKPKPITFDTFKLSDEWQGKTALLRTWELQPIDRQRQHFSYLRELRGRIRVLQNYINNRAYEVVT